MNDIYNKPDKAGKKQAIVAEIALKQDYLQGLLREADQVKREIERLKQECVFEGQTGE